MKRKIYNELLHCKNTENGRAALLIYFNSAGKDIYNLFDNYVSGMDSLFFVQIKGWDSQNLTDGSFDSQADRLISRGKSIGDATALLQFRRITALVKMTIKNLQTPDPVTKITFTAANKHLNGPATVNFQTEDVSYGNTNSIEINCNNATGFSSATGKQVMFMCWPADFANDDQISVIVETANATYKRTMSAASNTTGKTLALLEGKSTKFGVDMASAQEDITKKRPALKSVSSTASEIDGRITLVITWDEAYKGYITKIHYEVGGKSGDINTISGTSATVNVDGLTRGESYTAYATPYNGQVNGIDFAGETIDGSVAAGIFVPQLSSVSSTANETDGRVALVVKWDEAYKGHITKIHYEVGDKSGDITNISSIATSATVNVDGLTAGASYTAYATPYKDTHNGTRISGSVTAGELLLPKLSSVTNLNEWSTAKSIHLSVSWEEQYKGKISKIYYSMSDGTTGWIENIGTDATTATKDLGLNFKADQSYTITLTPYRGNTPGTALSNQTITAGRQLKLKSASAKADGDGVVKLEATWDASFADRMDHVTYTLYEVSGAWVSVSSGTMTITKSDNSASVRVTGLTPGTGPYQGELIPYDANGNGNTAYTNTSNAGGTYPQATLTAFTVSNNEPLKATITIKWNSSTANVAGFQYWVAAQNWDTIIDENNTWVTCNPSTGTASVTFSVPSQANYIVGVKAFNDKGTLGSALQKDLVAIYTW